MREPQHRCPARCFTSTTNPVFGTKEMQEYDNTLYSTIDDTTRRLRFRASAARGICDHLLSPSQPIIDQTPSASDSESPEK